MEFVLLAGPTMVTDLGVTLNANSPLKTARRVRGEGAAE